MLPIRSSSVPELLCTLKVLSRLDVGRIQHSPSHPSLAQSQHRFLNPVVRSACKPQSKKNQIPRTGALPVHEKLLPQIQAVADVSQPDNRAHVQEAIWIPYCMEQQSSNRYMH